MTAVIALTPELQENFRKLSEKMKKVGKALEKNPLCQAFCETTGAIRNNKNPRAAKFQLMLAHVRASRNKNKNPQTARDLFKLAKDFWCDASNPKVFVKKVINGAREIVSPILFTRMKRDTSDDSGGSGGDDDPDGDPDDPDHHRQIVKPLPKNGSSIQIGGGRSV
jgi:hypothetical protein